VRFRVAAGVPIEVECSLPEGYLLNEQGSVSRMLSGETDEVK
jgi:hypothetical protein